MFNRVTTSFIAAIGAFSFLQQKTTQAAYVDYTKNGADWPLTIPGCEGTNQSPIDLTYSIETLDAGVDNFRKHYENIYKDPRKTGGTKVEWVADKSTVYVKYDMAGQGVVTKNWYFLSNYASDHLWAPKIFYGTQFYLHSGSEHTIDGKRFDLEMQIDHVPDKVQQSFKGAILGILFDTVNYDPSVTDEQKQVIDKFFENLMLLDDGPEPNEIAFGQLIDALDTDNRWVYKGSYTTPNCDRLVYWNVLSKVYPISFRHLQLYKKKLIDKPKGTSQQSKYVDYSGNYRVTQTYDGHDLKLLKTSQQQSVEPASFKKNTNLNLLLLVILASIMTGMLYTLYDHKVEEAEKRKTITAAMKEEQLRFSELGSVKQNTEGGVFMKVPKEDQ